jgi:pSer/pThr/pTyr-binding forkhead associated (FHA) protein
MRASDSDREASAAILRSAYLRGELSTQTFDWRIESALGARTREQLQRLTSDVALPAIERVRRWFAPPPTAEVLPLTEEVVIGRADSCEIKLGDRSVSRRHASLRRRGDVWVIQDLGSTNGTLLNGRPVVSSPVLPGDEIELGEVRFRLA